MLMLETAIPGCTVRSWLQTDVPALAANANDREVWLNLRDRFPHPYGRADAEGWIACACGQEPERNFAITMKDVAIGGIGLELQEDVHRLTAEIGYWLGRTYWGQGLATAAVKAVTNYGFKMLGLCRIYAMVFEHNAASCRALEKCGYQQEGRMRKSVIKAGRTLDQLLYARVE
jgi:[ribosomal protein S5]-alanine N-acetyltransferase